MGMKKAKQAILWFLVFMVLFSAASLIRNSIEKNKEWVLLQRWRLL